MGHNLGGQCEPLVSDCLRNTAGRSLRQAHSGRGHARTARDVLVDVGAPGEGGDLVHEPVGEVPALGVVVVGQWFVGATLVKGDVENLP